MCKYLSSINSFYNTLESIVRFKIKAESSDHWLIAQNTGMHYLKKVKILKIHQL